MVRVITQDTFDDVVKENMEEFEMTREEAVKEAKEQFESQVNKVTTVIRVSTNYAFCSNLFRAFLWRTLCLVLKKITPSSWP